jgi:hypothetical protein
MRGEDENTGKMFSYVSAERRIPADHRALATMRPDATRLAAVGERRCLET